MIMTLYRARICVVLCAVLTASLLAWGPIGHMTVAYVAYQRLTLATRTAELNPDYANWQKQMPVGISPEDHDQAIFMIASTWADDIKGEPQYSDDGPDPGGNVPDGASSSLNTG
jgi:hypothetical protein